MVEKALDAVHFGLRAPGATGGGKSAKAQALDLIRTLQARPDIIALERARMRVRVVLPAAVAKQRRGDDIVRQQVINLVGASRIEQEDWVGVGGASEWEAIALIDPGAFRALNDLVVVDGKLGSGRVETLEFAAVDDRDDATDV